MVKEILEDVVTSAVKGKNQELSLSSSSLFQKSPWPVNFSGGVPTPSEVMETESARICLSFMWNSEISVKDISKYLKKKRLFRD